MRSSFLSKALLITEEIRCKWHEDEDQGVDDFLHDIEDGDNGYEDEAIICCRHSCTNACTYIIYNEHNYKCRTQFL